MAKLSPQVEWSSFGFYTAYNSIDYKCLGIAPPYQGANTAYTSVANAATGNGPSINFVTTATSKYFHIYDLNGATTRMINISGVDYVFPSTNGAHLRTDGTGSTYWAV